MLDNFYKKQFESNKELMNKEKTEMLVPVKMLMILALTSISSVSYAFMG